MSIIQGTAKGGSASFYDFPIDQSLRFDGSSYLSRTFGSGNKKTCTWSSWVKRSSLAKTNQLINNFSGAGDYGQIVFDSNDKLEIFIRNSSGVTTCVFITNAVYRDVTAWYHIVVFIDTTQATQTNRFKLYVNGVQVTSFSAATYPTIQYMDLDFQIASRLHTIGTRADGGTALQYFEGYLANIQFIDGQALDASYFGETKDDIWIPKTFDGTSSTGGSTVSTDYGTNGFLLDFSSISGTTINDTAPIDTNHSSANNWTATGF